MKPLLSILLLLTTCIGYAQILSNVPTGDKNFIDQNYIEVTGKSEMEISPDLIYLKILINEKDTKNKAPLVELEKSMLDKLKEIGIDIAKDLLIKDISSNFKYYWITKNEILLSKEYQLIVRDGMTASKVFIELEKIGISNISIEKLDHSNMVKFKKEVKLNAIKAAKEKAQDLAMAIGQNIGRAIHIQEQENNYRGSTGNSNIIIRGANSLYGSQSTEPEIDFEKIRLEYSIICKFELK